LVAGSPNTSTSSAASAGRAGARRSAKSQAVPSFDAVSPGALHVSGRPSGAQRRA
jgi:hypothetical protein